MTKTIYKVLDHLEEGDKSTEDLSLLLTVSYSVICGYLKRLHVNRKIYIVGWYRKKKAAKWMAIYRMGKQEDSIRPETIHKPIKPVKTKIMPTLVDYPFKSIFVNGISPWK